MRLRFPWRASLVMGNSAKTIRTRTNGMMTTMITLIVVLSNFYGLVFMLQSKNPELDSSPPSNDVIVGRSFKEYQAPKHTRPRAPTQRSNGHTLLYGRTTSEPMFVHRIRQLVSLPQFRPEKRQEINLTTDNLSN